MGDRGDSFYIYDSDRDPVSVVRGRALPEVMDTDDTLAVIPEGVMFNYLMRRRNPTPYITLMPPEFRAFKEDRILEAFKQQPPEFILFLDKDTLTEYKVGPFGEDPRYGRRIVEWIPRNPQRRPAYAGGFAQSFAIKSGAKLSANSAKFILDERISTRISHSY